MPEPRVSLIVVSWNALPLLRRFLPSVAVSDWPNLEVVLADNASTDGSIAWVQAALPGVRVIRHPENWGFCRGNNEAIRRTTGTYVMLVNNDVELDPACVRTLVAAAEADPSIAAVQPKLLQAVDRERFEYAGAGGGHLDRFGYPFARGRVFFDLERDHGQYDQATDIFWGSGAALLLRRSALDEVGLLEEGFEFHMEEIDLCWRLLRAGYRVVAEPSARAFHLGGGSMPQDDPRKTYYNFRNSLLMLYRNLPRGRWLRLFPARACLDAVAALRFLFAGSFDHAAAVVRAYAHAHRMKHAFPRIPGRTVPPSYAGSIVVDYFLRRRRTFDALPPDRFRGR